MPVRAFCDRSILVAFQDAVDAGLLGSWMSFLSSRPRSAQMLTEGPKEPLVADLLNALDHHTHEANLHPVVADKKYAPGHRGGTTDDRN